MNIAYLAIGSAASFLGCILALRQLAGALRKRWLEDAEHARAQRENTEAQKENTRALRDLTGRVGQISDRVDEHERRLQAGGL